MVLSRMIDEYAVWHEVSGHSKNTIALYRWSLGSFCQWLVANNRPTTINSISVGDARGFLQHEGQRDSNCPPKDNTRSRTTKRSDRSIHIHARSIRAFFNWLVNEEYLDKSPMAKLKPPKLEQKLKEVLSVAEVERLLSQLNPKTFLGSRMYAIIALLYDSGLRAGELCGVDIEHIDWTGYQVRVSGKGKRQRLVPFSAATHKALRWNCTSTRP